MFLLFWPLLTIHFVHFCLGLCGFLVFCEDLSIWHQGLAPFVGLETWELLIGGKLTVFLYLTRCS